MNHSEGRRLVRTIVDRFYDGGVPIGGGMDDLFDYEVMWGYWKDGLPSTILILDEHPFVKVSTGLVIQAPEPWSPTLFRVLTQLNESIVVGRAWANAHADGSGMFVMLQELVPLSLLSMDHQPSIDYLLSLLVSLPAIAADWAPRIMAACGGQPWTNLLVLTMCS